MSKATSSVHSELMLHLVKRGMDRAYAAVESVAKRYPGLCIGVSLRLDPNQLESGHWEAFTDVTILFDGVDREKQPSYIAVGASESQAEMEARLRAWASEMTADPYAIPDAGRPTVARQFGSVVRR